MFIGNVENQIDFNRGKDKKPRKQRSDKGQKRKAAGQIASAAGTGAGLGFAGVGLLPVRSKAVDKALVSKHMKKIPIVGRPLRRMAVSTQRGYDKASRKAGQYLAANLPAQTAGGIAVGTAAAGLAAARLLRERRKRKNQKQSS